MARYHSYDNNITFQKTDLRQAHFPPPIQPHPNRYHGPIAEVPKPEGNVSPWSLSDPNSGYPVDAAPMGYGLIRERGHGTPPVTPDHCHLPTHGRLTAGRYFPFPGQYGHGPPPRLEFAPMAPDAQTWMAGEVHLGPRGECVPLGPEKPRQVVTVVVRDLPQVLQEREKLRKDRGFYLQRTQSLAKELVQVQQQRRELAGSFNASLGQEEPRLQELMQLQESIENQLSSLRQADDSAIDQLLKLQKEALRLGHPPLKHPWTSDTDILLPDKDNERHHQEIAPPSCAPLPQPSPPQAVRLGHPPPNYFWTSDTDLRLLVKDDERHHQEPPYPDILRTEPPPTTTMRCLSGRHTGIIKSLKSSGDWKEAPAKGLILATVGGEPMEIYFGEAECMATLLPSDVVTFQVFTDLPTNQTQAVNVQLKLPETFQVTREKRQRGVIMNVKEGFCSIVSENHDNFEADMRENLNEGQLGVMDEVEFTALPVEGVNKAIRVWKLPEGTVSFGSSKNKMAEEKSATVNSKDLRLGRLKTVVEGVEKRLSFSADDVLTKASMLVGDKVQFKISTNPNTKAERAVNLKILADTFQCSEAEEQCKLWRPCSEEADVPEVVSAEYNEGTVLRVPPKEHRSDLCLGLLKAIVKGVEKKLSFSADDVLTKATMLVGDIVQFKISTNSETKVERAVSLEILADTFECSDTEEQRKTGVVLGLSNSFGYIKYSQDSKLVFDLSEVMEEKSLSISEKVEFTIVPNIVAGTGYQAIRIRRFIENVFTRVPAREGLTTAEKEKKKMTIKLINSKESLPKEARIDSDTCQTMPQPSQPVQDLLSLVRAVKTATATRTENAEDINCTKSTEGSRKRSSTSHNRDHRSRSRSRSRNRRRSRDRGSRTNQHRSHRSSSRGRRRGGSKERSARDRRSRSRSRERPHRKRRSRSKSRERSSWKRRRRSRSRERSRDEKYRSQSSGKECSFSRSRSPKRRTAISKDLSGVKASNITTGRSPTPEIDEDEELARKERELEELKAKIAQTKAILAMELGTPAPGFDPATQTVWNPEPLLTDMEESVERLPGQSSLSLQHYSATPVHREAHRDELYDPFKVDEEHEYQRKELYDPFQADKEDEDRPERETKERHRDDLWHQKRTLRDGSDILCRDGLELGLCKEEQSHRQVKEDEKKESYGEDIDDHYEYWMGQYKSLVRHDQKRKDQLSNLVHKAEPYDSFQVKEEDEDQRKKETIEGHRDDLWCQEKTLKDGTDIFCSNGTKAGLSIEEQIRRQIEVDEEDCYLYGEEADDSHGSLDKHDWERENQIPGLGQLEEDTTNVHRQSDIDKPFAKIKTLLKSVGVNLKTWEVNQQTDRTHDSELYGTNPTATVSLQNGHCSSQQAHLSDSDRDVANRLQPSHGNIENVKTIWICGDGLVALSAGLEESPTHGMKLGKTGTSVRSYWKGVKGMTWDQLVPQLQQLQLKWPSPDMLIIHLQGNDISMRNMEELLWTIQKVLTSISNIFPECLIVWSDILPTYRRKQGNMPVEDVGMEVDRIHDFNCRVHVLVAELGGTAITHENIGPELYCNDGIHLSHFGIQRFNLNVQHFVEEWEREVNNISALQHISHSTENTSPLYCPPSTATDPDVAGLSPATSLPSYTGTPRPAKRGGLSWDPAGKDWDATPEDSGNTIISLQQSQKQQVTETNEQPVGERQTHGNSQPITVSGQVTSGNVKIVWICGDSLVTLSLRLAKSPTHGMKLGKTGTSVRSYWKGVKGMTWDQLVPQLQQLRLKWPSPDMLIIHLGGNDINTKHTEELLSSMKKELTSIHNIFPQCLIVWSDILPTYHRKQGNVPIEDTDMAVDRIHDLINHRVHAVLAELGGKAVTHENIGPELYCNDGIHLSPFGIQRFNLNIQRFVDEWETEVNSIGASQHISHSTENTSRIHHPPSTSTGPDVSSSLSPTASSSSYCRAPRTAERGGPPLNPSGDDLDVTPVDSGNGIISLQQSQKQQVTETNEQPVGVRQTHGNSQPITGHLIKKPVGVPAKRPYKTVWMCGYDLVELARKMSVPSDCGVKMGDEGPPRIRVYQWGSPGMIWKQLLRQMCQYKRQWTRPDLLLIHLEGSDIEITGIKELLSTIKKDLTTTSKIFPQCLIVWSDILPRRFWKRGTMSTEEVFEGVSRMCDEVNRGARTIVTELGGGVVSHKNIGYEFYEQAASSEVFLTKLGIERFNSNIQQFLDKWKWEG